MKPGVHVDWELGNAPTSPMAAYAISAVVSSLFAIAMPARHAHKDWSYRYDHQRH